MCSPTDVGVKSKSFRLNDLSEILMNGKKATPPCRCGYLGHPNNACRCTPDQVAQYRRRISGPLLDRIDMHVAVPALTADELDSAPRGEPTAMVRARVLKARQLQHARQQMANAQLPGAEVEARARIEPGAIALLRAACQKLSLSARARDRVLRVGRTIADLDGRAKVGIAALAEALSYRQGMSN